MKIRTVFIVFLLIIAAFVRLYRIEELTEFLGDQGSAGVIIHESYLTRTIPLAGPKVSTGQYPGPFYYYLIAAPLLVSGMNPVAGASFFALLGVVTVWFLYVLGRNIFSPKLGYMAALLYALSPTMIAQNRNMWNPTAIPFFVTILVYALYKIRNERKPQFVVLAGLTNGILVQLHYTSLFVIGLTILFWIYVSLSRRKSTRYVLLWTIMGIIAFFIPLIPFIVHQYAHGFIDLRQFLLTLIYPTTNPSVVPGYRYRIANILIRSLHLAIPLTTDMRHAPFIVILLSLPLFLKRTFWSVWFILWIMLSVVGIGLFRGTVFDHYLYFITPLYFLAFIALIHTLTQVFPKLQICWYIVSLGILLSFIFRIDIFGEGSRDIPRTRAVVDEILRQAQGTSFSFTLVSSRSYSDYHYRFYFRMMQGNPEHITNPEYTRLFLVCEWGVCPSLDEMRTRKTVTALCFDHHCEGEYPTISLSEFTLTSLHCFERATLYTYKRLPVTSL